MRIGTAYLLQPVYWFDILVVMRPTRIEGSRKLTSYIKPMLATLTDEPAFDSPDWVFELKWDGFRAIAEINGTKTRLYSRNGLSFDKAYTRVFDALKKIKGKAVVDGEIVVLDESGKPSFQKLQNYSSNKNLTLQYYVFDIVSLNGKDVSKLPLLKRKQLLKKFLPASDTIVFCDHVEENGIAFFQQVQAAKMEGIIAKKADSRYITDKRTKDWLKIKYVQSQEAIIVGFTAPKGSRKYFGSLLLGVYERRKLRYIGSVGTGFTASILKDLYLRLKREIRQDSPLGVPIKVSADTTWVNPVLVCNVKYTEMTADGIVRHPVYQGLRFDKASKDVKPEKTST